jgi:hypothetical protein
MFYELILGNKKCEGSKKWKTAQGVLSRGERSRGGDFLLMMFNWKKHVENFLIKFLRSMKKANRFKKKIQNARENDKNWKFSLKIYKNIL